MAGQHEIPYANCPHDSRIKHLEDRINGVSGHVNNIENELKEVTKKQIAMDGDVKLLTHKVDDLSVKSGERHSELIGAVNRFGQRLDTHMVDEEDHFEKLMHPIHSALEKLHSRWWAVATAVIGGSIAAIVYLAQKAGII